MKDMKYLLISPDQSVREAMAYFNKNLKGIVLVVDDARHLLGTVTDGDVRRAILDGASLDTAIRNLLRTDSEYPGPVEAQHGVEGPVLLALMQQRKIRQLPLLDDEGRVVDLVTLDDLLPDAMLPLSAVVMAGGLGTRLRPLTNDLPKPMLPVGGRPLMEHIIEGLRKAGIRQVNVTTHYRSEAITEHFGDGRNFGVNIQYVAEDRPLGTVGALGLMDAPEQPLLVINGDILTKVDFKAMLAFHQDNAADLTVGVREYDLKVPYGVVETEGVVVQRVREKPVIKLFVNAGIYLMTPATHQFIPNKEHLDMTELIDILLEKKRRVVSFPICESWMDIGQMEDYKKAQIELGGEED